MVAGLDGVCHLDGASIRRWATGAIAALDTSRGAIDALNLFPVADADTGTNLFLTVAAGGENVHDGPSGAAGAESDGAAGEVARALAAGALVGARGNSGVILSQYLAGFAEGLSDPAAGAQAASGAGRPARILVRSLDRAQIAARGAVARPVDGTILTVAAAAAAGARRAGDRHGDPRDVVAAAVDAAVTALETTRQGLPVLRRAGVVDAGALGLVVVLLALQVALAGEVGPTPEGLHDLLGSAGPSGDLSGAVAEVATGSAAEDDAAGEFEVMFVVEAPGAAASSVALTDELCQRMSRLGQSVAIVGSAGVWQVHVHTDHPVQAIAAGARAVGNHDPAGRLRQVCVRHLRAQTGVHSGRAPALGVVVCTRAPDLAPDLARAGAVVLVVPDGGVPQAAEMERVIIDTGASRAVVLPGHPAARAAAITALPGRGLAGREVRVLDAMSEAQVVAAMAALAARAEPGPDTGEATLVQAIAATRTAAVPGPDELDGVLGELLTAGVELVTAVRGVGAGPDLIERLRARVRQHGAELVLLDGGQTFADLVLGAE